MDPQKAEQYLVAVFKMLVAADAANERREFMNALLRIIAMIIYESEDPQRSREIVMAVIDAALQEPDEGIQ